MKTHLWASLGAGLFLLTGCADLQNQLQLFGNQETTSISLTSDDVVVNAPNDFCIDTGSSRPTSGFALLAPCGVLQGVEVDRYAVGTVQIGEEGSAVVDADPAKLAAFITTDAGRSLLSSDGDVEVGQVNNTNGMVLITYEDSGTPPLKNLGQQSARAFLDVQGRLVTITFRGLVEKPISLESMLQLVRTAANAMRSANATSAVSSG